MTSPPESARSSPSWRGAAPLLLLILLLSVQLRSEFSAAGLLTQAWLNALHLPWAAITTLALWWLTRWSTLPLTGCLVSTACLALVAGAGTELAQHFVRGRNPSIADLLTNLLGIGLMLGWIARRHLPRGWRPAVGTLVVVCGLGVTLTGPVVAYLTLAQQRAAFPLLLAAESPILRRLIEPNAVLLAQDPLQIRFDDRPYPGIALVEQDQRWRDYTELRVTLELTFRRAVVLAAATHLKDDGRRGPIARTTKVLLPGKHVLTFPVAELLPDPEGVVERVLIYGRGRDAGAELTIARVELAP